MKSKSESHSTVNNIAKPLPQVDINKTIFGKEEDSRNYNKDSLIYQDTLRYGIKHPYEQGFRFTDLAKWLMRNNLEFIDYCSGNNSRTPISTRIGNRRERIQSCINNMIRLGLLREKDIIDAEKNIKEKIPLYDFTREGYLLAALAQGDEKRVLDILEGYCSINSSSVLVFITRFFRKELERGRFYLIMDFLTHNMLPKYPLRNGKDLLKIVFGIRTCLNWIIVFPDTFRETLSELNEVTKKFVLFQFKIEIEEYYRQYYLVSETKIMELNNKYFPSDITIAGHEWERIRFQNMGNHSKITVPGYCSRCNSVRIFDVDCMKYLDWIIAAHNPYPEWVASGKCTKCAGAYSVSAHVMRLPHLTAAWL